jgi:hypothetical protein
MRKHELLLFLFASTTFACVEVEPPIGQFVCTTPEECPSDWVCGADSRCYPSPLACYPHAQIGCSPGQGCYTANAGPVCVTAGPLAEYTHACDNANDTLRCSAGTTCVSFTEGTDDNVCLRYCRSDLDCGTAQCAVIRAPARRRDPRLCLLQQHLPLRRRRRVRRRS